LKEPAIVNLGWTTTFTPELLRKNLDADDGRRSGLLEHRIETTFHVISIHIG
jgi:hypothetical protein